MGKTIVALLVLLQSVAFASSETVQGDDDQGWYDGKIYSASSHSNYGGNATLSVDGGTDRRTLFLLDPAAIRALIDTSANILDSIQYEFYCNSYGGAALLSMYELWKPYKEGNSTGAAQPGEADETCWDHRDGGADSNWTSNNANSASDEGSFNRLDGSGYDRFSTAADTDSLTGTGWTVILTWAGAAVDSAFRDDRTHYGFIMISSAANQSTFYNSEEESNPTLHPKQTLWYHAKSTASSGAPRYLVGPGGHAVTHSAGGRSALHSH